MKCKTCGRYLKRKRINWDAVGVILMLGGTFGYGAYLAYVEPFIKAHIR